MNSKLIFLALCTLLDHSTCAQDNTWEEESLENDFQVHVRLDSRASWNTYKFFCFIESQEKIPNLSLSSFTKFGLNSRIVNGTEAITGQFPHQVSLRRRYSDNHFCGGSIIAESWIITAAHCLYLNQVQIQPWTIVVVGGEIWLNTTTSTGQRSGVTTMMIHQNFDKHTLENDLALLKLETPFVFKTSALGPSPLQTSSVSPGTLCQVAGWGYPAHDIEVVSNALLYVNLPLLSQTLCRQLLKNYTDVPDGMICAGYLEGGKDACRGDSGGGMICNDFLTGIVSGGIGCAWPKTPGIYTDINFYRSWIYEIVKNSTENDNDDDATTTVTSTPITTSAKPGNETSGADPTISTFFLLLGTLVLLLSNTDLE